MSNHGRRACTKASKTTTISPRSHRDPKIPTRPTLCTRPTTCTPTACRTGHMCPGTNKLSPKHHCQSSRTSSSNHMRRGEAQTWLVIHYSLASAQVPMCPGSRSVRQLQQAKHVAHYSPPFRVKGVAGERKI